MSVARSPDPTVLLAVPRISGGAKRPFSDTKMVVNKKKRAFATMYGVMLTPEWIADVPLIAGTDGEKVGVELEECRTSRRQYRS